jgi:hypothetical protein
VIERPGARGDDRAPDHDRDKDLASSASAATHPLHKGRPWWAEIRRKPPLHRRRAGRDRNNDSVIFTPATVARSQGLAGPGRLSMWKGAHRPVLPKRTGRANPPQIPDIDKAPALGSSYGTTPTIPRSAGSLQGLGDDKEGGSSDHQPAPAGAGQRHPH